ncbi:hypothetical protein BO94DRAFT_194910 [Aspergillus sclerotioniger CBS 115572]|uniref:Uncharacterized protein n=1 Tax=Aspergillus sclerotioniger CBS 115572 TaxID=1450535 RepID=A0A317VTJ4_9EURO|nr:hypothetical protein BO94DRAFT_194910 [Aspergillus sclerotioniger CBS 115572]PWY77245.1 hypothetical protein BO94DRAFT_194910 [Aspergillus sclerotioniger CBS 115572]
MAHTCTREVSRRPSPGAPATRHWRFRDLVEDLGDGRMEGILHGSSVGWRKYGRSGRLAGEGRRVIGWGQGGEERDLEMVFFCLSFVILGSWDQRLGFLGFRFLFSIFGFRLSTFSFRFWRWTTTE